MTITPENINNIPRSCAQFILWTREVERPSIRKNIVFAIHLRNVRGIYSGRGPKPAPCKHIYVEFTCKEDLFIMIVWCCEFNWVDLHESYSGFNSCFLLCWSFSIDLKWSFSFAHLSICGHCLSCHQHESVSMSLVHLCFIQFRRLRKVSWVLSKKEIRARLDQITAVLHSADPNCHSETSSRNLKQETVNLRFHCWLLISFKCHSEHSPWLQPQVLSWGSAGHATILAEN